MPCADLRNSIASFEHFLGARINQEIAMSDLRRIHTLNSTGQNLARLVSALIIVAALAALAAYAYRTGMWRHPHSVVPDSALPSPTSPLRVPAGAPH
jgi:hypothetical protein